jgi:hypothetical protein
MYTLDSGVDVVPGSFYVLSDSGSEFGGPFESAQAAAEWARGDAELLDFLSDGYSAFIAEGGDLIANDRAAQEWVERGADEDDFDSIPGVHNHAIDLGLVARA